MANEKHLALLRQDADVWNTWKRKHHEIQPDLSAADLHEAGLFRADLSKVNLREDIGKLKDPRSLPLLTPLLGSADLHLCLTAGQAISNTIRAIGAEMLFLLLSVAHPFIRQEAEEVLIGRDHA
jgi:hypothetical protein